MMLVERNRRLPLFGLTVIYVLRMQIDVLYGARKRKSDLRMIHIVLLSGGSGTRLWPLSNNARSKQFLKVLRDDSGNHISMVQRVFEQINRVEADFDVTIATCETQQNSIERQVDGNYSLVLEPERRDTAPAIMLACAHLLLEQGADTNDTVVVMPIDTVVDQAYYDRIPLLDKAVQTGAAELVLLGVLPTYPSEKYGYIIPDNAEGDVWRVTEFKEKPNAETAQRLIEQGALWNCGVFAFKLNYLKDIIEGYYKLVSFDDIRSHYSALPKNSFDYEVVEKASSVAVIPYEGSWKDLGTWNTLTEEMADAHAGRVFIEDSSCTNVHVINEIGLPLVVAGLKNAVVVATHDGILVADKEYSAGIKPLVEKAAESRPMFEKRQWGEYRVLDQSVYPDKCKALTKELIIESGKQLSYQKHSRRSETWTIVSGSGEVVIDGQVSAVRAGMVVQIEKGSLHSIRAFEEIHAIEVQFGNLLEEYDIERFGYYWES